MTTERMECFDIRFFLPASLLYTGYAVKLKKIKLVHTNVDNKYVELFLLYFCVFADFV